ncbi:MAG: asparagine synthase (glutamine-hydrolyzing) [Acidobacteria bacterium]|nr:asparagine synthase (glutamine-hydrolyzing) [Acidobacteriota bacterium]
MCGIAGIIAADRLHADERARLTFMRDVLTHRGPDDAGTYVDERAGLAHRRLSIVDLASGHQPLSNEEATIWIVFNGEIYNHREIRSRLEAAGHRYRTTSDTETIVHAYEQWGDDCVHHFRGMFAFAIWDAPRRRLLLARDRLGVKPLYWCRVGDRLLFASEIKAILESGLVRAEANEPVLAEVITTRYTSDEQTLFRGIFRLLPGHLLVYGDGRVQARQYWDVPTGAPARSRSFDDLAATFRELLEESVRLRLMSDVPLGMLLSGGIDSSAIAALMARMIARPLQTFSVAFKDRASLRRARHQGGPPRDRHRRAGLLWGVAAARVARGRADRAPLERPALLRLAPRARSREGGARGRGLGRTAGGLRQVSALAGQLARRQHLRDSGP